MCAGNTVLPIAAMLRIAGREDTLNIMLEEHPVNAQLTLPHAGCGSMLGRHEQRTSGNDEQRRINP